MDFSYGHRMRVNAEWLFEDILFVRMRIMRIGQKVHPIHGGDGSLSKHQHQLEELVRRDDDGTGRRSTDRPRPHPREKSPDAPVAVHLPEGLGDPAAQHTAQHGRSTRSSFGPARSSHPRCLCSGEVCSRVLITSSGVVMAAAPDPAKDPARKLARISSREVGMPG